MAGVSGTELDPAAAAWLRRVLPGRRITAAEPLGGGYRNENIRLVTDGGSYVLRRYLRGDAARTCAIEAALAARLAHLYAAIGRLADSIERRQVV